MLDHVHMCIEIPPKYPVALAIGFPKGKSAIAMARQCGNRMTTCDRTCRQVVGERM